MAAQLPLQASLELYELIPKHERPALRHILWQKIIEWRKTHKGQTGPEIDETSRQIADYSRKVHKELSK